MDVQRCRGGRHNAVRLGAVNIATCGHAGVLELLSAQNVVGVTRPSTTVSTHRQAGCDQRLQGLLTVGVLSAHKVDGVLAHGDNRAVGVVGVRHVEHLEALLTQVLRIQRAVACQRTQVVQVLFGVAHAAHFVVEPGAVANTGGLQQVPPFAGEHIALNDQHNIGAELVESVNSLTGCLRCEAFRAVLLGQLVGKLVEDALGQSTRRIVDVGAHFVSVHFQGCLNCLPVPVECG